jgi:hypothetical protein
MCLMGRSGMLLLTLIALSTPAYAQPCHPVAAAGGPLSDLVLNAPFSATAVTRVTEALPDGTVREHQVRATYHRDSQGRVRAALDTPWGEYVVLWIPGRAAYRLDPDTRTFRLGGRCIEGVLFNGEGRVAVPVGKACFRTTTRAAGASPAERLEAVNAQLSPDLGLVTASHWSDQFVSVDYQLTNIRRGEPLAELFDIPANYTFVTGSHQDPLIELDPWNAKRFCISATR